MKFVVSMSFNKVDELIPLAIAAEQAGFEGITFSDHVVHPETINTPYPYTDDGSRRWDAYTDWPDPWVAISACAAATTTLRLTNNVFVLPLRNPFFAAKAISTAAVMSNNRVTLTVGVGWSSDEYGLMQQEFKTRGKRCDEMIEIMKKLWTGEMVNHDGPHYQFDNLEMNPAPSEPIPIWVGGISKAAHKRAARNDGWLSDLQPSAEIIQTIEDIQGYRKEIGRDHLPFDVMASASDAWDINGYKHLEDNGVTHVLTMPWAFYAGPNPSLQERIDGINRFAEDVLHKM